MSKRFEAYPYVWRLPLLIWQGLFFVGPLILMVVMSFWLVRNYRMEPDFVLKNWDRMLGRDYFWNAYWVTLWRATLAGVLASLIAFPASYALAFRVSETTRRWAIFFLIVPFFTSYLVRVYAWQVLLAESGPINAVLGFGGLGPFTMLNSGFGAMVGYMTLVLPLVVILQTFSLAAIDRNLIEAAWNLGASPVKAFWQVFFPLSLPGLLAGALIVFVLCLGFFVTPVVLGGGKVIMVSMRITDNIELFFNWGAASALGVVLLALTMGTLYAASRLLRLDKVLGGGG